jgi:hypothetical protein
MRPVDRSEILPLGEYEAVRAAFRQRVIDEKRARRVGLGPKVSIVFENHDTVLLQIQEMLRTERITREGAIGHELETYNQLVPGDQELSATAFIEIADRDEREKFLVDAQGIERTIAVVVDGEKSFATVDPARLLPDRASAVLYMKFPLSVETARKLARGEAHEVTVEVDHAAYSARAALPRHTVSSLAHDFE